MKSVERSFIWAVQALAQPAEVQPTLFPPFVVVADELANDFDYFRQAFDAHYGTSWSKPQRKAISDLDNLLTAMSGSENSKLWLGADCLRRPKWNDVRHLAITVLKSFDWPMDVPPPGRSIYVQVKGD